MIHNIEIMTHDIDNTQSRLIVEVNGYEIDILADKDGFNIEAVLNDKVLSPTINVEFN